jgi:hypothetical protein
MRLPPSVDGVVFAPIGAAEVTGVDEIPDRAGVDGAEGVETDGTNGGGVLTLNADPGVAVTATRAPPSAITKTLLLGLFGGFHWMNSDPAV